MKKILLLLVFTSAYLLCFAQSQRLTGSLNAIAAGDSIVKQQVEYKDAGATTGRNLSWDFSVLKPVNDSYTVRYFNPVPRDKTLICGLEHRTRYYYRLLRDSLLLTGYENPTTFMQYSKPELRMRFPLTYGDTFSGSFEGEGEYSHRSALKTKGQSQTTVDAEGELTLPGGLKIPKALRTRTLRQYTETGKDSLTMTMDIYAWYAEGSRYPVFESIKSTTHRKQRNGVQDTIFFTTSFYYPPVKKQARFEDLLTNENSTQNADTNPIYAFIGYIRTMPNPVLDNLNINFEMKQEAQMWFTVHNNLGVPVAQTAPALYQTGIHDVNVSMAGQIQGVYSLYVHAGDMVLSLNIIKR